MNIRGAAKFRAVTGASEGFGTTPQEALSALMESLTDDALAPIVILPYNRGDTFFTDAQHTRLR
ncbi:MAG: hypothetical protein M3Y56_03495, partial [Armatimonadota bacterium]|nr:hypothetical protein [Armatimonadota bacterium]